MEDKAYNGWCCGTCLAPVEQFAQVWSGIPHGRGLWLTRLPLFVKTPGYRPRRTAKAWVNLEDITVGSGEEAVTYRAVSVVASAYADGSCMNSPRDSVVWFQVNWAPIDDLETPFPRAGLAVVKVADHTKSGQQDRPLNHRCELIDSWLVNDRNGEPEHWNQKRKLLHYHEDGVPAYKTLVGPQHFVYQERRVSGYGTNRLIIYGIGQATPTVREWPNPEIGQDSTLRPVFFDAKSFPLALYMKCDAEFWPDGGIRNVSRKCRIAEANPETLTLIDKPASRFTHHEFQFAAAETTEVGVAATHVFFQDYAASGSWVPSVEVGVNTLHLVGSSVADPPTGYPETWGDPESPEKPDSYAYWGLGLVVMRYEDSQGGYNPRFNVPIGGSPPDRRQVATKSRNAADAADGPFWPFSESITTGEPHEPKADDRAVRLWPLLCQTTHSGDATALSPSYFGGFNLREGYVWLTVGDGDWSLGWFYTGSVLTPMAASVAATPLAPNIYDDKPVDPTQMSVALGVRNFFSAWKQNNRTFFPHDLWLYAAGFPMAVTPDDDETNRSNIGQWNFAPNPSEPYVLRDVSGWVETVYPDVDPAAFDGRVVPDSVLIGGDPGGFVAPHAVDVDGAFGPASWLRGRWYEWEPGDPGSTPREGLLTIDGSYDELFGTWFDATAGPDTEE